MPSPAEEFRVRLRAHLTHYYRDTLGLGRLEERIRYREVEDRIEEARLRQLGMRIGWTSLAGRRMLVVGSGWGGMCLAGVRLGMGVAGIDVDPEAVAIARMRLLADGRSPIPVFRAAAEALPFPDGAFDLVYCFSVIEHVRNVEASVREMARVLAPTGYAYVQTQNFAIPWEPHYKAILPTVLGHRICRWLLRLRRRDPAYLDTVNFIRRRPFLSLLRQSGLEVIEEWDITSGTPLPEGWRDALKAVPRNGRSLLGRAEEHLGQVVLRLLPALGVKNLDLILRRRSSPEQ